MTLPAAEHGDRVAQVEHQRDVVLDDEEGDALPVEVADDLDHPVDQRRVDAAGRLVEQDHLRLEHEHLGQLDQLLLAVGQRAGLLVAEPAEADEVEQLARPLGLVPADRVLGHEAPARRRQRGHHVLQHRHALEQPGDLEGAAQAEVGRAPTPAAGRSACRRTRSRRRRAAWRR